MMTNMKMSPEQEAYFKKLADPHCYGEQDENGVDLSLIRANLKLSPEARLARGSEARRSALELQEIGRSARTNRFPSDR
jgi:hypothetical protein